MQESELYHPYLDFHLSNEEHRHHTLSQFQAREAETLTPSVTLYRAKKLAPITTPIVETGYFPLPAKISFVSLKRFKKSHTYDSGHTSEIAGVPSSIYLFYLSEIHIIKELVWLFQYGASRPEARDGLIKVKLTCLEKKNPKPFLFYTDVDVLVNSNLALNHVTPKALQNLLSAFAPYIAIVAYLDSWVENFLGLSCRIYEHTDSAKTQRPYPGRIFQRFLSVVNEYLSIFRAHLTALEAQHLKETNHENTFTLLEFKKSCKLQFDTLVKIHQIFVALQANNIDVYLENQLIASATASLLQTLYRKLEGSCRIGDDHGYQLSLSLFQPCFGIYLNFIHEWIQEGTIEDPFEEFMIRQINKMSVEDTGFETIMDPEVDLNNFKFNFELRPPMACPGLPSTIGNISPIPGFLREVSNIILLTGNLLQNLQKLKIHTIDSIYVPSNKASLSVVEFFDSFVPLSCNNRATAVPFYLVDDSMIFPNPRELSTPEPPTFDKLPYLPITTNNLDGLTSETDQNADSIVLFQLTGPFNGTPSSEISSNVRPTAACSFLGRSSSQLLNTIPNISSFQQAFRLQLQNFIQERHSVYNLDILDHLKHYNSLFSYVLTLQSIYLFQHVPHFQIFTKLLYRELVSFDQQTIGQFDLKTLLTEALYRQPMSIPYSHHSNPDEVTIYPLNFDSLYLNLTIENNVAHSPIEFINVLNIEFDITWPLDLVISPDTLSSYQKISRLLTHLQFARFTLEETNLMWKRAANPELTPLTSFPPLWVATRLRLFYVINSILSYFMTTILLPASVKFNEKLSSSTTLHVIKETHSKFISDMVKQCLLEENCSPFIKAVYELIDFTNELPKLLRPDSTVSISNLHDRVISCQRFLASTLSILSKTSIMYSQVEVLAFALTDF